MAILLTDADIAAQVDAPMAVAAMRDAILAAHHGDLVAPPRVFAPLGHGRLVVTAGRLADRWYGFRSYDTLGLPDGDQLVVLHDGKTGRVRAVALGPKLGARRTGAIGAVAVDTLARPDATTLGLVGAGEQAWTQVWAAAAVRTLADVTVYSRSPHRREAFAARVGSELGVPARATASAAAAVADRDVVVLATTSRTPAIEAGALAAGTHVNLVGPKQRGLSEISLDLPERASVIATDSPAQAAAYDPPMLLVGTPHADRMVALGAVLAGAAPTRRSPGEITLFCSVGLAGTEVFLLDRLVGS